MELNEELKRDLAAPIKSVRIFAIEKALREGCDKKILGILQNHLKNEEDAECRMLIDHALEHIPRKINPAPPPFKGSFDPDNFLKWFRESTDTDKMEMLLNLSADQIRLLSNSAPDLLEAETDQTVGFTIIRTFADNWPSMRFQPLTQRLFSRHLGTQLAALKILVNLAPTTLLQDMPQFLTSSDPHIRALATMGLASVDLDEAILHLDALLTGSDLSTKRAVLQNCIFLPFERIKPLLLKFISMEQNPELLEEAGLLFESNPDLEVPFKLWEVYQRVPEAKAQVVKRILKGACDTIKKSQILKGKFPAFIAQLQDWIKRHEATRFVQQYISDPALCDSESALDRSAVISKYLDQKIYREAFEKTLTWSISEEKKSHIRSLLDGKNIAKNTVVATTTNSQWEGLSEEDKIRRIASFQPDNMPAVRPLLEKLIRDGQTSTSLSATSFRAARRLKIEGLTDDAEKRLQTNNPNLLTSVIEYLALFDMDRVIPRLGQFLQSSNPWIKSVALTTLQQFDPSQAVSSLAAMLRGASKQQHSLALGCMIYFDFSLVRDILTDFMITTTDNDLHEKGMCLYIANPEPDNLYALYRIEQKLSSSEAKLANSARKQCEQLLSELGVIKSRESEFSEAALSKKWETEQGKKVAAPPPYSIRVLKPSQAKPQEEQLFHGLSSIRNRYTWLIAIASVALIILYLLYLPVNPPSTEVHVEEADSDKINIIEGIVKNKNNREIILHAPGGEKCKLMASASYFTRIQLGGKIRAKYVAFGVGTDGIVLGRPIGLDMLDE